MRKMIIFASCVLFFGFGLSAASAQDGTKPAEGAKAAEPHYYHLELVVQELGKDGKPTNSRSYTTTVCTDAGVTASIRTQSKIPIITGSSSSSANSNSAANIQYQYQDVGVKIDAQRAHQVGNELSLDLTADVSSIAAESDPRLHEPIFRENRWQAFLLIPIRKPTIVFTSDALDSKGSTQLVVTATPIP